MTTLYRFSVQDTDLAILAPGQLQQKDGVLVVVATMSNADATRLWIAAKGAPLAVHVEVEGVDVAWMPIGKLKANPRAGHIEVWAMVSMPSKVRLQ